MYAPSSSSFSTLFSLAAVNPDVYTGSSALAPAGRVPGVLSAVRDVRQQTGMAWPAGRAGQPSALWTDRHVAVISLWQAVRAAGEPPTSTRPLSSHLTTDRRKALNSQLGTRTPPLPLPHCCTVQPLWLLNSVGFLRQISEMHWCGRALGKTVTLC